MIRRHFVRVRPHFAMVRRHFAMARRHFAMVQCHFAMIMQFLKQLNFINRDVHFSFRFSRSLMFTNKATIILDFRKILSRRQGLLSE